jgi:hypothetical protein
MKELKYLSLVKTAITDSGLSELKEFRSLEILDLVSTNMSNEAIAELRQALPGTKVGFYGSRY